MKDQTKEIPLYKLMLGLDTLLKLPQPIDIATVRRNQALRESIRQLEEAAAVYEKYGHELNQG